MCSDGSGPRTGLISTRVQPFLEGPSPVLKEGPKPAQGPQFSAASVSVIFGIVQFCEGLFSTFKVFGTFRPP